MSTIDSEGAANIFLARAIQDWPHHRPVQKIAAVQTVVDMAGFQAKAVSWPVFGGKLVQPCQGPEGEAATVWLNEVMRTMPRGDASEEIRHLKNAIDERIAGREGRLT